MNRRLKQSLLVGGAVTTIGFAGLGSVGLVNAATTSSESTNPQSSLVDKLVNTFNLNKDDVQKVFDEERTSRMAEREQRQADQLNKLVEEGKLTQAQVDKLIAKANEVKAEREANRDTMKDKTHEERKAAMEERRAEMKQWLGDNDIPEEYGRFIFGGHGRGHGGPGGRGGPMPTSESN